MKNKKITILYVIGSLSCGGTEKYLMDFLRMTAGIYNNVVLYYGNDNVWADELKQMKVRTYNFQDGILKMIKSIKRIAKIEEVDIVYSLLNRASVYVFFAALLSGIKKRIVHAHRVGVENEKRNRFQIRLMKIAITILSTDRLACSDAAAASLFAGRNYKVISNGIDIPRYSYSERERKNIRKELKIDDRDIVIGMVGRIDKNKNQKFALDVLRSLNSRKGSKYKLIVIGKDSNEDSINKYALNELSNNSLLLLGAVDDVYRYYNAFDIFLMTSKSEGLPYVFLEAQCNGLPCFVSDCVPEIAGIIDCVNYLPLNLGAKKWADEIYRTNLERVDGATIMKETNFNLSKSLSEVRAILNDYDGEQ